LGGLRLGRKLSEVGRNGGFAPIDHDSGQLNGDFLASGDASGLVDLG
jgi:hypothetical protein